MTQRGPYCTAASLRLPEEDAKVSSCTYDAGVGVDVAVAALVVALEVRLMSTKYEEVVREVVPAGAVIIVDAAAVGAVIRNHKCTADDVVRRLEARGAVVDFGHVCEVLL